MKMKIDDFKDFWSTPSIPRHVLKTLRDKAAYVASMVKS